MHEEPKGFVEIFREKIQRQIEDIVQMNIVTAVSTNITGYIPPEAERQVSFIEARPRSRIARKMPGSNNTGLARQYIDKTDEHLSATVLVRTIIELDGDIAMLLRSEPVDSGGRQIIALDNDILAAHQANVTIALENWHFFVLTILDALKSLTGLANQGK